MSQPREFGQHVASEVVAQATTFVNHCESAAIWPSLHEPRRGRMTPADVARGRALLAAANAAVAANAHHKGDSAQPTHTLDTIDHAATAWLADQTTHARGLLEEQGDDAALDALDAALIDSQSHKAIADNVRAYIALARRDDATGASISASYATTRARDAILRDGEHLVEQLDAALGTPAAARGTSHAARLAKDTDVEKLARWLHRWSAVARRTVGAAGLETLGLAHDRHHPAHRPQHPVSAPSPGPNPPPAG